MDDQESLDTEMTELQECSYEALDALSQEDEVEELQNSLREAVQDQSVKPKLQCLMVDPSFSMVTVQSEDSGIVWETASSRCSTPWASETSSVADSMEGSAGKITIIFDEEKVVRRRTRSRSSRLSDRYSRPGSSRSASALGVERPEMMEMSLPNVKQDKTEAGPDLEEIKNKDQQLFSLISEGYEILNIRVPSKLPTVDEEESTELQDNLSYLDQTPRIKSRNHHQWTPAEGEVMIDVETQSEESKQETSHSPTDTELKPAQIEGSGDIDYFEKFTLLDVVVPGEQPSEQHDEMVKPLEPQEPEQTTTKVTIKEISPTLSEESFVFVPDVDIVGEHLDEVFYGEGPPADLLHRGDDEAKTGRVRRQSSIKESGSKLFQSEETVLTPIYISSGPPKIIDPILLEEPTAMSFMYSDLYEDAMGEKRRSDEECSEAESVTSEKSFKRFFDNEEADSDYLEMFILKDETPAVEVQTEVQDKREGGRIMWEQNEFAMLGRLTRVAQEEDIQETKKEEIEVKEVITSEIDDSQSAMPEQQKEVVKEEKKTPETEEEKSVEVSQVEEEIQLETQKDQSEIAEAIIDAVEEGIAEMQEQELTTEQNITEKELPKVESPFEMIEERTDMPPAATEIQESISSVVQKEGIEMVESMFESMDDTVIVQGEIEITKDPPLEVSTDCEPPVHAHVEVIENLDTESEIQTQVRIDLQEATTKPTMFEEEVPTEANDEDLGQQTEVVIQDDTRKESDGKIEVSEPLQEVASADVSNVSLAVEDRLAAGPQMPTGVVKEMVSVGDELILLVPKGQAVEMDIEISPQPEKGQAVVVGHVDEQCETFTPLTEATPETEIQATSHQEKVIVGEDMQTMVESASVPVEESIKVDQQSEMIESEMVSSVTSDMTQQDLPVTTEEPVSEMQLEEKVEDALKGDATDVVPMTESQEVEQKVDLEKQEVVSSEPTELSEHVAEVQAKPQIEEKIQDAANGDVTHIADLTPTQVEESQDVEQKIDMEKHEALDLVQDLPVIVEETKIEPQPPLEEKVEDGVEKDVLTKADSTPVLVEESQEIEKTTDLEEHKLVSSEPSQQQSQVTIPEPVTEIQTQPQLEDAKTEEVQGKVDLTSTVVQESHEVEQIADLEEHEIASSVPSSEFQSDLPLAVQQSISEIQTEKIEVVQYKVDLTPTEEESQSVVQKVKLGEQELPTTQPDLSILPAEVEVEELDYEIISNLEAKEPLESDKLLEEPQQEPIQDIELPDKEMEEDISEYKTETEMTVAEKEAGVEEQGFEEDLEEDTTVRSTLKRFTPLEDLSGLHNLGLAAADIEIDNALEQEDTMDFTQDVQDVCMEEEGVPQKEQEIADVTMEAYEIISKQDTEMAKVETEIMESIQEAEKMAEDECIEEKPTTDTELMEVDFETIDADEEQQARLAAELQGLDWYCLSCGCLLSDEDHNSGEHQSHEVTTVDQAYEGILEKLGDWISELQGRSENIEDLVSELELAYNSVEDQCVESEAAMQAQNEEMMALVMDQYNNMSVNMEEEKKAKLEQLYDQIVSFQESIDSAKGTLETSAREAETEARTSEDIQARLNAALDSAMSLELGPRGLLVFEDYAKGNTSSSQLAQRKGIPVPQRPTLQAQEPGSATSASVTVYWKVNPEDVIDCFQVYCMEDPQGAVSEEYRVTVKESYCVLEELEPDKMYKVWVMAVNYTGCSLPSERLTFKTAPSVPVIDTERCTVTWDSAILRWSSAKQTPRQFYTLEYCRQYELEGEGLRSISGITNFEQTVLLQPNEKYLFYIKAVNEAGSSEQSEAALISTKGTRFHLLKATAHPALELSVDQTTLHYSQDIHENLSATEKACPSILGELLPMRGRYYWETDVSRSTDYRIGVAYSSASRDSPLGENDMSWCFQCVPTPTGGNYLLVHNNVHSNLFVIDIPERIGIFLDYQFSRLSFYNTQSGQLLGSFNQRFTQPCHPAVGVDAPGSVEVCMAQEVPEFTKDS